MPIDWALVRRKVSNASARFRWACMQINDRMTYRQFVFVAVVSIVLVLLEFYAHMPAFIALVVMDHIGARASQAPTVDKEGYLKRDET